MPESKVLKKFCSLSKYLEKKDKDFYGAIDDLCLLHYLRPNRGSSGITFLYPKEKSYRDKFISEAYGKNPEQAVSILRSLIIQEFLPNYDSFTDNVINTLHQKIDVDEISDKHVKLSNGLKLERDSDFTPMDYRQNIAVYTISGKGMIPTDSQVVSDKQMTKKGGFMKWGSSVSELHKFLEDVYVTQIGSSNNIYVVKVYLHLEYLLKKGMKADQIAKFLGNDEFSDSYLLDMLCKRECQACFSTLLACLKEKKESDNIVEKYITLKKSITDQLPSDSVNVTALDRIKNIQTPIDIRERVKNLYGNNDAALGKDLFITFCNISKDLWINDYLSKVDSFRNFAYVASKVYTSTDDILKQEFDVGRDLTLYGNLLKSDVFKFTPKRVFEVNLPVPSNMPSPLDMNLYSLCGYINQLSKSRKVTGGNNPDVQYLLEKL